MALAVKFAVEVAKEFTNGVTRFYDEAEYAQSLSRYGSMKVLQTMGNAAGNGIAHHAGREKNDSPCFLQAGKEWIATR